MRRTAQVFLWMLAAIGLVVATSAASAATLRPGDIGPRGTAMRLSTSGTGVLENEFARARHTCAVIADGTVRCWGDNFEGQLGNGSTDRAPQPAPVTVVTSSGSPLTGVVSVAAGFNHACAARVDGTVFCWGQNSSGQLGTGSTSPENSRRAVQVVNTNGSAFNGVTAIAAGFAFTCALRTDGAVHCWGRNREGQLGRTNTGQLSANPGAVTLSTGLRLAGIVTITAGHDHACAIQVGGTDSFVHCWGSNAQGQLGTGSTDGALNPPRLVTLPDGTAFQNAMALAAGVSYTCALRANGAVHCWGRNDRGQIGNDSTTPALNPVNILANAVAVAGGAFHACAVVAGGTARCWGLNDQGQIGNNQTGGTVLVPTAVTTARLGDAVAITAGGAHSCARRVDDSVRCWGDNFAGQLGNATTVDDNEPVPVIGIDPVPSARGIAAGSLHTCATRASSEAACWGDNTLGQLGNDNRTDQPSPVALRSGIDPTRNLTGIISVATGASHACAVLINGTVQCWGRNSEGQLGTLGVGTFSDVPVQVQGLSDAVAVAAGGFHSCALRVNSTVRCWGRNNFGQLGDGTATPRPEPVTVTLAPSGANLNNVVAIAAGASHSCALRANGSVRCWGANVFGQLGDGTAFTNAPAPRAVPVLSLPDATALATVPVANHNCALRVDGRVTCWGRNFEGQLGNGNTTSQNFPVPVNSVAGAVAVTGGSGHSCAVLTNGFVACWGVNGEGQLGNGSRTTPNPPAPVLVAVGAVLRSGQPPIPIQLGGAVAAAGGALHTCARLVNGLVGCWGDNTEGQIGDGTREDRLFATAVPSFTFNVRPVVTLGGHDRIAHVTALASCDEGATVQIHVQVTQGGVSGEGRTTGRCTGALELYDVTVAAHGPEGFEAGPAMAVAEAIVRDRGEIMDEPQWTRAVVIVP